MLAYTTTQIKEAALEYVFFKMLNRPLSSLRNWFLAVSEMVAQTAYLAITLSFELGAQLRGCRLCPAVTVSCDGRFRGNHHGLG
jgi:hypothetical protein